MIRDILKPKSKQDVIDSLKHLNLPSYRLSSFLDLINLEEATKVRKWCLTVFHMDPKEMQVKQFHDGSIYFGAMQRAVGASGWGFASNADLKLLRMKNNYYAYPKGELGNILQIHFKYKIS